MSKPLLIIVDGNSFIHRAYHAMKGFSNSKGFPTGAIHGTATMLLNLRKRYPDAKFIVSFDSKEKNFRHEMFKEYKANRPPMDDDLRKQIPLIKEFVSLWGSPTMEIKGVESDDSMGTLAVKAEKLGYKVIMSTSDKDMRQLVNENILILDTKDSETKEPFGIEGVIEKENVHPSKIIDKLALMGDNADNIPGVKDCGKVTAVKWIEKYGSVEGVIENADDIGGAVGEKLRACIDDLILSKKLVTIDINVQDVPEINDIKFKETSSEIITFLDNLDLVAVKKKFSHIRSDAEGLKFNVSTCDSSIFERFLNQKAFYLNYFEFNNYFKFFATDKYGTNIYNFDINEESISFLKKVIEKRIRICTFSAKELLKKISVVANVEIPFDFVAHDVKIADYVCNGGRSSEVSIDYINEMNSKMPLSNLRVEFKLEGNSPQYKKMTEEQITEVKSEELSLISYLFMKKYFNLGSSAYKTDTMLLPILANMELAGARIDKEQLTIFGKELDSRIADVANQIYTIAGEEFNISSPKQVGEILFDKIGIPSKKKSTAEKVLEAFINDYPIIKLIFDYRSLSKLKSTYVDGLLSKANGDRLHTDYKQTITSTGRLSSREPNLQNIPIKTEDGKRIRKAFISEDGYKILAADYSQIELRVLAHMAQEKNLMNAFANNEDVHKTTASLVMNKPLEEVTSEDRRIAKAVNFGLIYGLSAKNLAKQLGIEKKEAESYYKIYFEKFDSIKPYFESVLASAKENLFVITEFDRKLPTKDVNSSNGMIRSGAELSAKNAPVQGTAADIIKLAMLEVAEFISNSDYDVSLFMQVHDELVFEVREDIAEEFALEVQKIMENAVKLDIPLVVDYNIADNYSFE